MSGYVFTKNGYEALKRAYNTAQEMLKKSIELKSDSGTGQDGWHDEGYKIAVTDEAMWSRRLAELQSICAGATIIEPKEQNEIVELGTGVVLKVDNKSPSKYILEGFAVEAVEGRLSIHSPLGKAIMRAKRGEEITFQVGNATKKVTIIEIHLPSEAEKVLEL